MIEQAIAIIGMAGRFPGASNIEEFWENLCQGKESISEFAPEELKVSGVSEKLIHSSHYVKVKGILEGVEWFDADFFGLSAKEAQVSDPQHRLFLECSWEALENAGYSPHSYPGSIGVYGGCSFSSYLLNHIHPNQELKETLGEYLIHIGNEKDFLTTRVSYKLNLRGPSLAIQTACSTSLVAVGIACNHLLTYQCDMALAGGSSISLPQQAGYSHQEGMIFSSDGHCRPFDAKAEGTVRSNGVGIVVLKRLQDALEDRDHIYAIIRGYGMNNDGSDKIGYFAPSAQGQAEAIQSALAMAEINPETIAYAEAHGTGTLLGDPIEIQGLTKAFRTSTSQKGYCALGSVKSNIGHLFEAAGVAGLIKTVLSLYHRTLLPSLHFTTPNPHIDFASSPFYVNTVLQEWKNDRTPRRACVSSFGVGGTNAHVVLEESSSIASAPSPQFHHYLLILSAKTLTALKTMAYNLGRYLKSHPSLSLADVTYTLQVGREAFNHRHTILCSDREEAILSLQNFASLSDPLSSVKQWSSSPKDEQSPLEDAKIRLQTLAQQWMSGATINWESLYQNEQRCRVPLPTYPFEKKRHWIDLPSAELRDTAIQSPKKEEHSLETIQNALLAIWKDFFGSDTIGIQDDFFQLGGDSLLTIQILAKIQTSFHLQLPLRTLLESPTIAKLAQTIEKRCSFFERKEEENLATLVCLKAGSRDHQPLFLLHPIDGQVFCYKALAELLVGDRPIYGLQATQPRSMRIEERASSYIRILRTLQLQGPYYLLGFSFGGILAYEIARQFQESGDSIAFLCMIDVGNPQCFFFSNKEDATARLAFLLEFFEGKPLAPHLLQELSREEQIKRVMKSIGLAILSPAEQQTIFEMVDVHGHALMQYQPKPYPGKILFFEGKEKFFRMQGLSLGSSWQECAKGGMESHEVGDSHLSMMTQPHVASLATILNFHLSTPIIYPYEKD